MRRSLVTGAVVLLLGVVLSACDGTVTSTAASVNGRAISQQSVNDALDSIRSDAGYRCVIEATASTPSAIFGAGSSTYDSSFAAGLLLVFIQQQALHGAVAALGLGESSFARNSVAVSEVEQDLAPQSGTSCTESAADVYQGLGSSFRNVLVSLQTDEDTLAAHLANVSLTTTGLKGYQAAHPSSTKLSCVEAVEVASQATANSLANQVRAGGNFAAIAKANSLDTASAANGGQLGCIEPAQLSAPLGNDVAALALGGVTTAQFSGQWVVLKVTARPEESLPEVAFQIINSEQTKLGAILSSSLAHAQVNVDPTYGSWVKVGSNFEVRPSSGPANSLLLSPAAATPSPPVGAGG